MRKLAWAAMLCLTAASGCAGADGPSPEPASTPPSSESPAPFVATPIPVDEALMFGVGACVPDGATHCSGAGYSPPAFSVRGEVHAQGAVAWNGTLTFTWDATSPTMERLTALVIPFRSCGAGCSQGSGGVLATGTSPLVVLVDLPNSTEYPDGLSLLVLNEAEQTPVWYDVTAPTEVRVAGEVIAFSRPG